MKPKTKRSREDRERPGGSGRPSSKIFRPASFSAATYHEKIGGHHSQVDFAVRGKEPKDEVQICTWKDATLRELTDLEVSPASRRQDTKLSFAVVYPDKNGHMQVKKVGESFSNPNKRRLDDNKALTEINFQIGDYLDVLIE